MPRRDGAQADFGALGANERRHRIHGLAGRWVSRDRRAASVVAMKAEPRVHVDFGAVERPDDRAAFRAHDARSPRAAILGITGIDAKPVAVDTQPRDRPQPRRPLRFVLGIDRCAGFDDRVLANRVQELP